jgi:hypothetical protein
MHRQLFLMRSAKANVECALQQFGIRKFNVERMLFFLFNDVPMSFFP